MSATIMANQPLRVLFLCTGNSARSQMAEAMLRDLSNGQIEAFSAGSVPAAEVHPLAKAILEERYAIDTTELRPKPLGELILQHFDYVVTLCDRAAERCPIFPGDPARVHWAVDDPAAVEGDASRRHAFESAATEIEKRLREWMLDRLMKSEGDRIRSG